MDAVGVVESRTCADGYMLKLTGFAGLECEYAIFPGKLHGKIKRAQGAEAACMRDADIIRVNVKFTAATAEIVLG